MGETGGHSHDLEIGLGFTGNFPVKLDSGLRIAVPARFREVLDRKYAASAAQLVVIPGDGKLKVLPVPVWQKFEAQLVKLSEFDPNADRLRSFIFGNMAICPLDAQNRIRLNPSLCEMAGLEKEVVVVGQQEQMELWNANAWKEFNVGTVRDLKAVMAEVFRGLQPRANG